ncbi:hypothetical protein ABBQ38_010745 [Trebouxia sp. C0009 RCD-2024]
MSETHEVGGLSSQAVEGLRQKHGFNEVKTKPVPEWKKLARRYTDWISIIVIVAAIVSAAVPNDGGRGWTSFVLLIIELNLICFVGWSSERNAGNAVKELEALLSPSAQCNRDGKWQEIEARELVPGDLIQLKGGDVIPADAKLHGQGVMKVDESSLTGESLAVSKKSGSTILAGAVVAEGEMDAVVTAIGKECFFGKTMALLDAPQEVGHLTQVLNRLSAFLAAVSFFGVLIIFLVLLVARDAGVGYSLVTAFVIFVSSVPIGVPVVTTTVLAVGARQMAKEKAIVSRLSALEELSGMEVLCSDKTGTLTLNKLSLDQEDILTWKDHSQAQVLLLAALSAKWTNNDAIDRAVTNAVEGGQEALSAYKVKSMDAFSPVSKKTSATFTTPDGKDMMACKGAPQVIRDLLSDSKAQEACNNYIAERASKGLRSLGVAISHDGGNSWELAGLISLLDPPRSDSAATIRRAQEMGIQVKMVTGDQYAIAVETSRRLGLGTKIMEGEELLGAKATNLEFAKHVEAMDGFAGVFPEHKHRIVEAVQLSGRLVGMTGDGVNDAPALKKANVGIAVAGATGAAKGAADIIFTEEGISTIITAIQNSHKIFRRLETYIIYRIASSLLILGYFFFAILIFDFEMPTWVLVLINLLNDVSAMATSLDKVHSSDKPRLWNMNKDVIIACALCGVDIIGAMILTAFVRPVTWFTFPALSEGTDQGGTTSGPEVACVFLGLCALLQLNLLSTRNPNVWWWFNSKEGSGAPPPSLILVGFMSIFLLAATFVGVYWPSHVRPDGGRGWMEGAGWKAILLTWAWALAVWQLADFAKFLASWVMHRAEDIQADCRHTEEPLPAWVKAVNAPGVLGDRFMRMAYKPVKVANKGVKTLRKRQGGKQPPQDIKEVDDLKSATPLDPANGVSQVNGGGGADNV